MNIPFFTDYLMLSNPLSIGIIAVFVLALIGIYVLQRKGTSFGNLVIIGTIAGAVLGIAVQIIAGFPDDPSKFPTNICLISGPSRTADIELVTVDGAHGPIQVTYVLVNR